MDGLPIPRIVLLMLEPISQISVVRKENHFEFKLNARSDTIVTSASDERFPKYSALISKKMALITKE